MFPTVHIVEEKQGTEHGNLPKTVPCFIQLYRPQLLSPINLSPENFGYPKDFLCIKGIANAYNVFYNGNCKRKMGFHGAQQDGS